MTEETAEETVETVTEEDASNERNGAVDENALEENAIMPYADEEEDFTVGKALILWSFNQAWDDASYRKPFYASTESDWEANGLDTTVNYNSTVEDYKKLEGYDVIVSADMENIIHILRRLRGQVNRHCHHCYYTKL